MEEKLDELKTRFKAKTVGIIADIVSQELGIPKKIIREDTEIPDNAAGFTVLIRMSRTVPRGNGDIQMSPKAGKKYLCTVGELAQQYVDQAFKAHGVKSE